jgi:protein-S-isoprenylcysteine O-methyltransferase Ste14
MPRTTKWNENYKLPIVIRLLLSVIILVAGVLPSTVVFFYWVQQNCSIDHPLFQKLKHEVIPASLNLSYQPIWIKLAYNIFLFVLFGLSHSFFASTRVKRKLANIIPPQMIRTFYVLFTGKMLMIMILLWENTDTDVWRYEIGTRFGTSAASQFVFWALMVWVYRLVVKPNTLEFFGFKDLWRTAGDKLNHRVIPELETKGIYKVVRHPMLTLMVLAVFLTPEMTYDRFALGIVMLIYCLCAVGFKEEKLLSLYGEKFLEYSERVPALVPFMKFKHWKKL